MQAQNNIKKLAINSIFILSLIFLALFASQLIFVGRTNAACATPTTDYGTVTQTIDVKSSATYRAWVRLKAPNTTDNSVFLEIDGQCFKMGDKSITPGQWIWVDYTDANTNNKANVNLSTGQKTVKLIGREQNVRVDKVILTTYTECVPLSATDECAPPPDTTKPTISITSPTNNQKISGTVDITTSANDNEGIKNVQFLIDGSVVNTDSQSPYTYSLDTTKLSEGEHSLVARVTDTSDNFTVSTPIKINVANQKPDLVITSVSWSPLTPKVGDEVTYKATIKNDSATPVLNTNSMRVEFKVDGQLVSFTENDISKLSAGQSVIFTASSGPQNKATWTATTGSHTVVATVDTTNVIEEISDNNNELSLTKEVASLDTTPPSVSITSPSNEATVKDTIEILATATDEGGSQVSRVEFYIQNRLVGTDTTAPYSYSWNTKENADNFYEIYARAYDNASNSSNSEKVQLQVQNAVVVIPDDEAGRGEDVPRDPEPPSGSDQNNEGDIPVVVEIPLENLEISNVDIDNNNVIDEFDLSFFFLEWGQKSETSLQVDFNNDGIVNVFDLSILLSNWSF